MILSPTHPHTLQVFGGKAANRDELLRWFADVRVSYLTESIYKVVLQKSIPAQIRQLILYYY